MGKEKLMKGMKQLEKGKEILKKVMENLQWFSIHERLQKFEKSFKRFEDHLNHFKLFKEN